MRAAGSTLYAEEAFGKTVLAFRNTSQTQPGCGRRHRRRPAPLVNTFAAELLPHDNRVCDFGVLCGPGAASNLNEGRRPTAPVESAYLAAVVRESVC